MAGPKIVSDRFGHGEAIVQVFGLTAVRSSGLADDAVPTRAVRVELHGEPTIGFGPEREVRLPRGHEARIGRVAAERQAPVTTAEPSKSQVSCDVSMRCSFSMAQSSDPHLIPG